LTAHNVSDLVIQRVKSCILATKMPQSPRNLLESILCDADLFHLGTQDFEGRNKLMLQEYEYSNGTKIDKSTWRNHTIQLMDQHSYHTEYAQKKLNSGKANNLEGLLKKTKESIDQTRS
jgi:predicted metal-dependent HD superfamily phosphohydrolase